MDKMENFPLKYGRKPKDLNYPVGSLLFDVRYNKKPECFEVVYWSPLTNRLEVNYEEPIIDIWFKKEEFRNPDDYQMPQIEREDCYVVYCKPSNIAEMIVMHAGDKVIENSQMTYKDYYEAYKESMGHDELTKVMCTNPWVFKADFTPDVYFRLRWINAFGKDADVSKVSYAFVDIEVDVLDKNIDPKNIRDVSQPINAVTIIMPHVKICAVLILGPRPRHRLHEKFHHLLEKQEKEYEWVITHQEEFKQMIIEEDEDNKKYISDFDIRLHFFDFDKEINLIKTVFDYINKYRPMFVESWNAKFDHPYLMYRIAYLDFDPKDIILPKEFKTDNLYYHEDKPRKSKNAEEEKKNKSFSVKNSKDWFFTSTYSVYICQMRIFAAVRKSQAERRSYSLSSVGKDTAEIDKLTNTKSGSFRSFAYTDFIKFILYNVRDVVVQYAIEYNVNDCQSIFARSYMFATQYSKCFQETHIVRNTREMFFESCGYIQACRLVVEPGIDTAYKGAYVAPTEKNAPTGYMLNGKNTNNLMYGVLDADAKAYYPSNKMGLNLDPMSLMYKALIDNKSFTSGVCVNLSMNQEYIWHDSKGNPHQEDMSGPIINSYKNKNEMSLMHNWFNLPTVTKYFQFLDSML